MCVKEEKRTVAKRKKRKRELKSKNKKEEMTPG